MRIMDAVEVEENIFTSSYAKLHGGMCKILSRIICKVLEIFRVVEGAQPKSRSAMQALCSLHIVLEKAKSLRQHCMDSSKLYLAVTGHSVLMKFEKVKFALLESLRRVEDTVPLSNNFQLLEVINELEGIVFSLNPLEKKVGDEIIALLQQERKYDSDCVDANEMETFHQAVSSLGITSSRAALAERRALKRLIEKARKDGDRRKESIVCYLLHLLKKYSKFLRSEFSDDNDSQGSAPCSPTLGASFENELCSRGNGRAFNRQFSRLNSLNFSSNDMKLESISAPPEEFRCPISLQLMYDPVIISSGQTYDRVCIEKWFHDGYNTCPRTQQQLSHLCLIPNYCVKGLISSWCEQNGIPVPDKPPESIDLNYWRSSLSESEAANSGSIESIDSCQMEAKVFPFDEMGIAEQIEENLMFDTKIICHDEMYDVHMLQKYEFMLAVLIQGDDPTRQCRVVEHISCMLKDDEEARICMGGNGFAEALVQFLKAAIAEENEKAQDIGTMALFNLCVNNNRNKEKMLHAGIIPLLEDIIVKSNAYESATALYLSLSSVEEAKQALGASQALPFLVELLQPDKGMACKLDALAALYNLSTHPSNLPFLLGAGLVGKLRAIILAAGAGRVDRRWAEKSIAILINLASDESGKQEIVSTTGLVPGIADALDAGEPVEQEQAISCLLVLCNGDERCSQLVLQEGVIPSLVSASVNGTERGKEKAQELLMLFRQQRQREREPSPVREQQQQAGRSWAMEKRPAQKPASRKLGRALSSIWRSKHFYIYQC